MHENGTVDREEVNRFAARADAWWDPNGSFRALHQFNPVRLGYIRSQLSIHFARDPTVPQPFAGLSLLDIGCGGGLVSEPMARLGFAVTGIDASAEAIAAAQAHAQAIGLAIDYRAATPESLAARGEQQYDAVMVLELIEHVASREVLLGSVGELIKSGGALIAATLNRTAKSFVFAIIAAEHVLRWLPRGTHDWRRFVRPSELVLGLRRSRLEVTRLAGISFDPQTRDWSVSEDLSVNYLAVAVKRRGAA